MHVLSIDYRLAPEHPAPAAIDDAYAAFRWACEHAAELGADPGKVAVGGDSAGGNLAAVVSQLARDDGDPAARPVLQWLLYPRTDFTAQTRSHDAVRRRLLADQARHGLVPCAIPGRLRRSSRRIRGCRRCWPTTCPGLPPALIATAGFDPLRDEGEQYAAALHAAGTAVDLRSLGSLTHAFANFFPLGGGSATATAELVSALRAHLSRV